jgi:hypothetical protein
MKEQDLARNLPGKVKLSAPQLHKNKWLSFNEFCENMSNNNNNIWEVILNIVNLDDRIFF